MSEETGYTVESPTFKLVFPQRPGLTVRMQSVSIDESLRLDDYLADLSSKENVLGLLHMFADNLVSWNLTEQDPDRPKGEKRPVGTDFAGVSSQNGRFIFEVAFNWYLALTGVNEGKETSSDDGPELPDLVASLPMETLSPSPES